MGREIILHCFQWRLLDIVTHLDEIAKQGFTAIQITPLQGVKEEGYAAWIPYQPTHMSLIGNPYIGGREELKILCEKAKDKGIKIIADVVLRHTAGDTKDIMKPHKLVDKILSNTPQFWTNAPNTTEYHNRFHLTHMAFGMPMLDYNNPYLQMIYVDFLQDLKSCGVSGFRIDMGKHFALESEGSDFWKTVFGGFTSLFNYAECLECDTTILNQYSKFVNVLTDYNNPTDKSKSVRYIMSHDTEETWGFTKGKQDCDIILEWRNLLQSHKESHVLFYPRRFSTLWDSEAIRQINVTDW